MTRNTTFTLTALAALTTNVAVEEFRHLHHCNP
jgi:hypothetical protein